MDIENQTWVREGLCVLGGECTEEHQWTLAVFPINFLNAEQTREQRLAIARAIQQVPKMVGAMKTLVGAYRDIEIDRHELTLYADAMVRKLESILAAIDGKEEE